MMKYLKNNLIVFTLSLVASISFVSSCMSSNGEITEYQNSFGIAVKSIESADVPSAPYYIVTDDSLIIYPVNSITTDNIPENGSRVLAQYTVFPGDEAVKIGKRVNISQVELVKTLNIITSTQMDTLQNDAVNPMAMWFSCGLYGTSKHLTIYYQFSGSDLARYHYFDLVMSPEQKIDGYAYLEFHHDDRNDFQGYTFNNYLSFPLPAECTAPGVKGLKITFDTFTSKQELTINY